MNSVTELNCTFCCINSCLIQFQFSTKHIGFYNTSRKDKSNNFSPPRRAMSRPGKPIKKAENFALQIVYKEVLIHHRQRRETWFIQGIVEYRFISALKR